MTTLTPSRIRLPALLALAALHLGCPQVDDATVCVDDDDCVTGFVCSAGQCNEAQALLHPVSAGANEYLPHATTVAANVDADAVLVQIMAVGVEPSAVLRLDADDMQFMMLRYRRVDGTQFTLNYSSLLYAQNVGLPDVDTDVPTLDFEHELLVDDVPSAEHISALADAHCIEWEGDSEDIYFVRQGDDATQLQMEDRWDRRVTLDADSVVGDAGVNCEL